MNTDTVTDTEIIKPTQQNNQDQQEQEQQQRPFTTLEIGLGFFENFDFYKPTKIQEINNNQLIPKAFKQEHIDKIDDQINEEVKKGKKQYEHIYNKDKIKPMTEKEVLQDPKMDFDDKMKEIYLGNPENPDNKNKRKQSVFMVNYTNSPIEIVAFLPNDEYNSNLPLVQNQATYDENGNRVVYQIVDDSNESQQDIQSNNIQQDQNQQQGQVEEKEKEIDIYNDEEYFSENIENYKIITPIFRQMHSRHNKNFRFNFERQKYYEKDDEESYDHYEMKNSFRENTFFQNSAFYKLNLFNNYLRTPKFYIQNEPIIGSWWTYQQSHRDPYRYITFHQYPYLL